MIYGKHFSKSLFLFLYLIILLSCVLPQNKSKEDLYIQIEKEIMCPVCDGQTLDQSQSLIANDMKNTIRMKINDGYNKKQIKEYFVERYGESVIAYPPINGFNSIAYIVPILVVLIGVILFLIYVKKEKKNNE